MHRTSPNQPFLTPATPPDPLATTLHPNTSSEAPAVVPSLQALPSSLTTMSPLGTTSELPAIQDISFPEAASESETPSAALCTNITSPPTSAVETAVNITGRLRNRHVRRYFLLELGNIHSFGVTH